MLGLTKKGTGRITTTPISALICREIGQANQKLCSTLRGLLENTGAFHLRVGLDGSDFLILPGQRVHYNSSGHRKHVDAVLKEELGPIYIGIPQFYESFFRDIDGLEAAGNAVFQGLREGDTPLYCDGSGWQDWPKSTQEKEVLEWLSQKFNLLRNLAGEKSPSVAAQRKILTRPAQPLPGSNTKRKLDVAVVKDIDQQIEEGGPSDWSRVLVPGELKSGPDLDTASNTWRDLGRFAREVFSSQETRRFVLGFTLCGPIVRPWEFDRLGATASSPFDVNKDGLQFVLAMLGYFWMNDEQLGFDPSIMTSADGRRFIEISRNGRKERLVFDELVKPSSCVAGRATTCWRAHMEDGSNTPVVIKDSWQYPEREEEGKLLQEVTEKGIINVARRGQLHIVLPLGLCGTDQQYARCGTPSRIWRRNQQEGPINDTSSNISLQRDEATNQLTILECRDEWHQGSSEHFRTYYRQPLPSPSEAMQRLDYERPWKRLRRHYHPERTLDRNDPLHRQGYSSSRAIFSTYNLSTSTFIDLISSPCPTSVSMIPPDRLRLRMVSRKRKCPIDEEGEEGVRNLLYRAEQDNDGQPGDGSEERFASCGVHLWPPDDAPTELIRLLCPSNRAGEVKAVADERSLIYAVNKEGLNSNLQAINLISFDPALRLPRLQHLQESVILKAQATHAGTEVYLPPAEATRQELAISHSSTTPHRVKPTRRSVRVEDARLGTKSKEDWRRLGEVAQEADQFTRTYHSHLNQTDSSQSCRSEAGPETPNSSQDCTDPQLAPLPAAGLTEDVVNMSFGDEAQRDDLSYGK
ncbi:hypothetical protein OAory_01095770 [Aspergillus oryzae]|uniref:Fungal-type protein kinase domain-containing protein n=1 Tax=Aspergillus oryzae TaxID=5062 RepID=A0A1S9D4Q9_ASPOZ|nr:hypothetical protein OAory_01095770 [Aspergillus oryzae]